MLTKDQYNIVDGTHYHPDTPAEVVRVLELARQKGFRIRLHYGDADSGRDWLEEFDVTGRVGRSMGPIKIPIILANSRSVGGPGILDHRIVKITTTERNPRNRATLYEHSDYDKPKARIIFDEASKRWHVYVRDNLHATFANDRKAIRWVNKMNIRG